MEDLPLGRTAALVPELAVKDLPLGKTLMAMMMMMMMMMMIHSTVNALHNTNLAAYRWVLHK